MRLTDGCYITDNPDDAVGRIEYAFNLAIEAEDLEHKFKKLNKEDKLESITHAERIFEAVEKELISKEEGKQLEQLYAATREAIRVDHFTKEELINGKK